MTDMTVEQGGCTWHEQVYLLAGIRLHLREVEADALVQTEGLMGGGAALHWVTDVVQRGDVSRAPGGHPRRGCLRLWNQIELDKYTECHCCASLIIIWLLDPRPLNHYYHIRYLKWWDIRLKMSNT